MRMPSPPGLGSSGYALRAIERGDIAAWYAYLRRPEVFGDTSWNLRDESDLAAQFAGYESEADDAPRRFASVSSDTGMLAGTIGFHTVSSRNRSAEVTYDLAPEHWGRGLATAACRTVTAWSFGAFGWRRVQATALAANHRSCRVLERCGYAHEGLLRAFRDVRGAPGDFHLYARLASDS